MPWNDEKAELLKVLWSQGLSAAQIASRLGGGITRNAVISKRIRMKLPDRGARHGKATTPRKVCRRPRAPSHLQYGNPAARVVPEPFTPAPDLVIPPCERKPILTRDKHGRLCANDALDSAACRWPYGSGTHDDPFYFCGKDRVQGLPYCPFHKERAFAPPQPRRRRPELASPARATEDAEAA